MHLRLLQQHAAPQHHAVCLSLGLHQLRPCKSKGPRREGAALPPDLRKVFLEVVGKPISALRRDHLAERSTERGVHTPQQGVRVDKVLDHLRELLWRKVGMELLEECY